MSRIMYDGIYPSEVPLTPAPDLIGGYVGGNWPDFLAMCQRYPNAIPVSIAVAPDENAQVFDCENGNGTPDEMPAWVQRQRSLGTDPSVYCNQSTWPAVINAFHTANVPEPHYWIANYDGVQVIPAGAVAKQYGGVTTKDSQGNVIQSYDISIVADDWPGVDMANEFSPAEHELLINAATVVTKSLTIAAIQEEHNAVLNTQTSVAALRGQVAGLNAAIAHISVNGSFDPTAVQKAVTDAVNAALAGATATTTITPGH